MTSSILAAMTLIWVKWATSKTRRMMRSVIKCWMSISSTASMLMLGLSERAAELHEFVKLALENLGCLDERRRSWI